MEVHIWPCMFLCSLSYSLTAGYKTEAKTWFTSLEVHLIRGGVMTKKRILIEFYIMCNNAVKL